jgi:hypothetical protein
VRSALHELRESLREEFASAFVTQEPPVVLLPGTPTGIRSTTNMFASAQTLERSVLRSRVCDDIIVLAVRWYVRYGLSYAEVSEWLAERGILVDQTTIYHWVQRFLPLIGAVA